MWEALRFAFEHSVVGPLLVAIALLVPVVRYRWKRGNRTFRGLFLNPAFLTAFASCAVVLCLYYGYRYRYCGLPAAFGESQIGILIGEVPGDTPDLQRQRAYAQAIYEAVQGNPKLKQVVKVELLRRTFRAGPDEEHSDALNAGHWLRPAFVLRPHTVESFQQPWLTVVDQPSSSYKEMKAVGRPFATAELANLDQMQLHADLTLLAQCTLALSLYGRGSYEDAAAMLKVVLDSGNLPKVAPIRGNLTFFYGNSLLHQGRYQEAIAELRRVLALMPDFAEAHINLVVALGLKGDLEGSIAELREAIRLKPDWADAHNNLGNALGLKRDLEGAIAEYRAAIRLKPDGAGALSSPKLRTA